MIRPPGFRAAAFETLAVDDARHDPAARRAVATELGIGSDWAYLHQVHGATVIEATAPGLLGDADGIVTTSRGLPLVVATADCLPIVIEGEGSIGVAHAGWRGLAMGIIPAVLSAMADLGDRPLRAAIGPGIGPCCYEVGPEVAERFPGFVSTTSWGTTSIDLAAAAADQLAGLDVWTSGRCTRTDPELRSYRGGDLVHRQVAVGWLP